MYSFFYSIQMFDLIFTQYFIQLIHSSEFNSFLLVLNYDHSHRYLTIQNESDS